MAPASACSNLARLGEISVRVGAARGTSPFFGCVARKGVTGALLGTVAGKGLRGLQRFLVKRGLIRENMAENIISTNG
jgi:hypothetical protein